MTQLSATIKASNDPAKLYAAKGGAAQRVYAYCREHGMVRWSGKGFTRKRGEAWTGSLEQFEKLCRKFGHDPKVVRPIRTVLLDRRLKLNSPDE